MPRRARAPLRPRDGTSSSRVYQYGVRRHARASVTLAQLQRQGFPHPRHGHFVMMPRDFLAVIAYESKAVVQVLLEVLDRTIGVIGDGPGGRGLWVELSTYECAGTGLMSRSAAQRGIATAVQQGYLRQRVLETDRDGWPIRYEYSLHWRGISD
jgi:hypothetical protein